MNNVGVLGGSLDDDIFNNLDRITDERIYLSVSNDVYFKAKNRLLSQIHTSISWSINSNIINQLSSEFCE
jgi:hypothetical protein